ncbi:MAG: hypothetical protein IIU70_03855, partial [Anaerotignum sp.]|nr:hypothetical protein [Anaerotignum sp.]
SMKKLLCLLLFLLCLAGCQPMDEGDPDSYEIPADEYHWAEVGATILLPEGTMEHCDVHMAESGALWFDFHDGGDTAFWLEAWEKGAEEPLEEQLGVFTLGETDTHIIQVMTSTCGTLNNEKIRPLWEEMRAKAAEMTEENIVLTK